MRLTFDAVVLAGGGGRRLGGVDKGALEVGGLTLLDRVLSAAAGARRTVVVGEARPTPRPVGWVREDPPDGGPLAGLAAGLAALDHPPEELMSHEDAPLVVVLATDLPRLTSADVERLTAALGPVALGPAGRGADPPRSEAAVFVDPAGRLQPLAAAYRVGALRAAVRALSPVHGRPVSLVLDALAVIAVPDRGAATDCDTPEQLATARAHFDRRG